MSTKSGIKPRRRLLNLAVLAALGGGALAPASSSAANLYWACGSALWDATCWSNTPGGAPTLGQPLEGDTVYLIQSDATNRVVDYSNTAYPPVWLNGTAFPSMWLYGPTIDATGTGKITLSQTRDTLAVSNEIIGLSGTGAFTQSGGTHRVDGINGLDLGYNSGSTGSYNLSAGSLSAYREYIGLSGTGTFNQSGGTHTYYGGNFQIGSGGTYNLSAGSLSASRGFVYDENIYGTFNQSGGTHTTGEIANYGTYNLSAGSLSASGSEYTFGTFNQSGGTHTVGVIILLDGGATTWAAPAT